MATETLLRDLEPTVESLLERHLTTAKEWFPHELVPYEPGPRRRPRPPWTEDDADLGGVTDRRRRAQSSLIVNLLTEDNLPYYFRDDRAAVRRATARGARGPGAGPPRRVATRW